MNTAEVDAHGLGLERKLGVHIEQIVNATVASGRLLSRRFRDGRFLCEFLIERREFLVERHRCCSAQIFELVENIGPLFRFAQVNIRLRFRDDFLNVFLCFLLFSRHSGGRRFRAKVEVVG